jgi:hypothetical protein
MRYIITILCLISFSANATVYYIKVGGNDANTGTSDAQAWAFTKLSSFTLTSGDQVLFRRGDTFYGNITATTANVTYGAYGTGNKPVITGLTELTSWATYSTNIYRASVTIGGGRINLLTLNGSSKAMGRFPKLTVGYGGMWTINSRSSGSITSTSLSGHDYTGAEVVIRKSHHIIERFAVSTQSGSTINFSDPSNYYDNGNGFFMQNHITCLSQQGDWMYDAVGGYIYIYLNTAPSNYTIKVSTVNQLFTLYGKSNVVINGLDFEGANANAIDADVNYGSGFTLTNSTVRYAAGYALRIVNTNGAVVTYDSLEYNSNGGIYSFYSADNSTCTNNYINYSGMLPGNGASGGGGGGIGFSVSQNTIINDNQVLYSGYCPISLNGSRMQARRNLINNFNLITDDGGGIYFQRRGNDYMDFDTCWVEQNIVMNGLGNPYGISTGESWGDGLYSDDRVRKVIWKNNRVFNCSRYGAYIHTSFDQQIVNNTIVNCGVLIGAEQNDAEFPDITIHGLTIKNNTLVTYGSQYIWRLRSAYPDNRAGAGTIDSNAIHQVNTTASTFHTSRKESGGTNGLGTGAPAVDYFLNFTGWKALGGSYDAATPNSAFTSNSDTRFEYNPTSSARTVDVPGVYNDLSGSSYPGSVTVPAYSAFVLQKISELITPVQIKTSKKYKVNTVSVP